MSDRVEIMLFGEPPTYSTNKDREEQWKNLITEKAVMQEPPIHCGIYFSFRVSSHTRKGKPFDVDNLCVPAWIALRRAYWFGGNYANLRWWHATKKLEKPSGLTIIAAVNPIRPVIKEVIFQGTYSGKLPKSGRDAKLIEWAKHVSTQKNHLIIPSKIGLAIYVGDNASKLTYSQIKRIIDCLYPIIGGKVSKADDSKISTLFVEKGVLGVAEDELEICIWAF
jgi:hypothetical protein